MEITQDGFILEDKVIREPILIKANNVTIRRCDISAPNALYAIQANFKDKSGRPFKNFRILGNKIHHSRVAMLVQYALVRGNHIFEMTEDAIKVDLGMASFVSKNRLEKIGTNPDSHADGVQCFGGSLLVVFDNDLDMPKGSTLYHPNACVFCESNFAPLDSVYIVKNRMNGGNYTVYLKEQSFGIPEGCILAHNTFGRDFAFGPLFATDPSSIIIYENYWQDGRYMEINNR